MACSVRVVFGAVMTDVVFDGKGPSLCNGSGLFRLCDDTEGSVY